MSKPIQRATFSLDRILEYFTSKELAQQIGAEPRAWPLALLKELVDNALDAAETAGVAPAVHIELGADFVRVTDNGPGIPPATILGSLDYSVRVSDKAAYVSPSRGQLGNALKCVWAAPFVLDGTQGRVDIETGGTRYLVDVALDEIAQRPVLTVSESPSPVKNGTAVTMRLEDSASYFSDPGEPAFYRATRLLDAFARFNPHVTIRFQGAVLAAPTDPDWRKWTPSDATDPAWYTDEQFTGLVRSYIGADHGTLPVRDFMREFAGLSGTTVRAQVLEAAGLVRGATLATLAPDGKSMDQAAAAQLRAAMIAATKRVKPERLGVIGADAMQRDGDAPRYKKITGTAGRLPFVVEAAFAYRGNNGIERDIVIGINGTPMLGIPFYDVVDAASEALVEDFDPVTLALHVAIPRVGFTDRAKSHAVIPREVRSAIVDCIASVCRDWTRAVKRNRRGERISTRQWEDAQKARAPKKVTVKDAAYACMKKAYLKASSGGTLPSNARQVMYAARPLIIQRTGKSSPWSKDSYFTQILLPDYIREHPDETADWDIVYDDRGHLSEPHTGRTIGLGTLAVRQYLADWRGAGAAARFAAPSLGGGCVNTCGPAHRFGGVVFIEKEGFTALLDRVRLAARYDIAIMSTKGVSVTSARTLVERLTREGIPLFVIRDLDKYGLTIARTLYQDTRRFQFETPPNVTDLGLTLVDAQEMGLEPEPVTYGKADKSPRDEIRACGATEDEADFLCSDIRDGEWVGQRIELNAMDSGQFVAWIERKLTDAGVQKVIPDDATLAAAYRHAMRQTRLAEELARLAAAIQPDSFAAPGGLTADVREILEADPAVPWDVAVRRCVNAAERAGGAA